MMNSSRWSRPFLVISLLLLLLMPSDESLWIDETYTAYLASRPSIGEFVHAFVIGTNSEHQMPLSMGFAWVAAKVLGTSEYALRVINLFWGGLAVGAMFMIGRRVRLPWLPLLFSLHPFLWHYMNEARPYAMQIACGAGLCLALVVYLQEEGRSQAWSAILSVFGVLLCGSSLLGVVPFAAVTGAMLVLGWRRRWVPGRTAILWLCGGGIVIGVLGVFYLWTLTKGAAGARYWPVSSANLLLSAYELGGFSGIGPARHVLREAAAEGLGYQALFRPFVPIIACLVGCYLCLITFIHRAWTVPGNCTIFRVAVAITGMTTALLLILSIAVRWPFWGRHLAPLLPFVVLIVALLLAAIGRSGRAWLQVALLSAFLVLHGVSGFRLRFDPSYGKDDYRTAAGIARQALNEGKTVWWSADGMAANYYDVPLTSTPTPGAMTLIQNQTEAGIAALVAKTSPDVIIATKPSLLDAQRALREFSNSTDWRLTDEPQTFKIYRRVR